MAVYEIMEYENKLKSTDYVDNKLFEAFIKGDTEKLNQLKEKYAQVLIDRDNWRKMIRQLESEVQDVNL